MKRKYSQKLIYSAVDFLRVANEETENGLEEEQVYAMMDAFDPALKRQLMMEMLMGTANGTQSGRDFMQKLNDWVPENGEENAFGTIVKGQGFVTNDQEYYVPKDCYAVDLDSFRGPTLYRK